MLVQVLGVSVLVLVFLWSFGDVVRASVRRRALRKRVKRALRYLVPVRCRSVQSIKGKWGGNGYGLRGSWSLGEVLGLMLSEVGTVARWEGTGRAIDGKGAPWRSRAGGVGGGSDTGRGWNRW